MNNTDWRKEPPFITTRSGAETYEIRIKVKTVAQMHDAHDLVIKAFADADMMSAQKEWYDENQG